MKRYFMYLAYDGTNYCGWQTQPNGSSVQETLEKALSVLLRHEVAVVGAGRTDAGVHARRMVAHFDAEIGSMNLLALADKLNAFLPKDIAIEKILPVKSDAHARFDATSRLYKYYITSKKDAFNFRNYHRYNGELDVEKMNVCANILFDYVDFTSFSRLHTDVKTNDCTIMYAQWEKEGDHYVFTIKANRFLRNMVRAIVGTLLEAGRGRLDAIGMNRIIRAKDRRVAGASVPANALFLEEVEYEDSIFEV